MPYLDQRGAETGAAGRALGWLQPRWRRLRPGSFWRSEKVSGLEAGLGLCSPLRPGAPWWSSREPGSGRGWGPQSSSRACSASPSPAQGPVTGRRSIPRETAAESAASTQALALSAAASVFPKPKKLRGDSACPPWHQHLRPRLPLCGGSGSQSRLTAARSPVLPWKPAGLPSGGVDTPSPTARPPAPRPPWLSPQDEKDRIEALGGFVSHMDCWRVNGTLAVSRAIGKQARGWEGAGTAGSPAEGLGEPGAQVQTPWKLASQPDKAAKVTVLKTVSREDGGKPLAGP